MSSGKRPTDLSKSSGSSISSALAHKIRSTSHWASHTLFISFMANNPIETIRDVRDRRRAITWDVKNIAHLRNCLRAWVKDEVPADIIGAFLVNILYQRDYHLGYRLTTLVRADKTAAHIARRALAFYQVHDKAGKPLWVEEKVPTPYAKSQPLLPTPEHADPRWPAFLDGLNELQLEKLLEKLPQVSADAKNLSAIFRELKHGDMSIIQTFHRFNAHSEDSPEVYNQLRDIAKATKDTNKTDPLSMKTLHDALPSLATEKPLPDLPPKNSPPPSPPPGPPVTVRTFNSENQKTRSIFPSGTKCNATPARKDTDSTASTLVYTGDFSTPQDSQHPALRRPKKSEDLRKDRERGARH